RSVQSLVTRISRQYPLEVLQAMLDHEPLAVESLASQQAVEAWTQVLERMVAERADAGSRYSFAVKYDADERIHVPVVTSVIHGVTRKATLSLELFRSQEYREICRVGAILKGLVEPGAYVKRGEKTRATASFHEALEWLMADAMKGHYLQRYKGLGEMNPEQLWETTMDPGARRMLRVNIEDAMAADQLFYTLMGDQVEPRREFIESNALQVSNLDI